MPKFISHGPTDHPGAAGLVPVPARDAHAYQSRGTISGSPGTTTVPAPRPGAVPQDSHRALHRSSDAPDYWRPGVYYEFGQLEHAPVSVLSDTQMPVPAVDPRRGRAIAARRPVFLGQTQTAWPKALQSFPNRGG